MRIGDCYENGKGCNVDQKKSFEYFEKAANLENKTGYYFLNYMLNNLILGIYKLGRKYQNGEGCIKNEEKALELYF